MRVALYIRVSTDEQAKEGFSIPAQKERLTQYAQSQDWDLHDFYIEEGFSAKDTNRPELQRMMDHIRKKEIDIVLVYRLDRLTRSVLDLYRLLQEFEKYEVKFKSATEVYDTTSAIGRLFLTLVAALAQWERENLAERVRFGMEQMVLQEKRPGGPPPYGYNLVDRKLVINEDEAAVVRYIFNRYLSGVGMNNIAIECNQLGYRTKSGKDFSRIAIYNILQNHAYFGTLRWNYREGKHTVNNPDDWILFEGTHPAIIDKEMFKAAKRIHENNKPKHPRQIGSNYIFSSVAYCARCNAKMVGHTMTKKNSDYIIRRYICQNARIKKCDSPALTDYFVEESFVDKLDSIIESYSSIAETTELKKHKKSPTNKKHLESELKKIGDQRKRFQILFSEGLIDIEDLRERVNELREKEERIKTELTLYEAYQATLSENEVIEIITNTKKVWEKASTKEKKQMVYILVKKIVLDLPDEQRKKRKNKKVIIKEIEFN
ncbi:recombinase family protein [Aneurinibacillus sp. Ricciae_BoGa-3]|uniref:recombinase family protein n=1 Tax=Aneurinibacillus sp. Ricciae_BoGa-3 TaxID=3022697 RepID=UPI00233FBDA1|nr:recombinase family protein [Aneurinibacillus sp. Ricciae_BoGa-3]WCK52762.1 recombinase family protein [Aneurinibacillus sp. Ricciae_BoGa-3]